MALVHSAARLRESIDTQIARGNLDLALRLVHRAVDQVNCEPINTARIFGSKLLDNLCQEIGAIHWRRIRSQPKFSANPSNTVVVYVASRLHASGGHNAVLADMIRLSPPAQSVILLTGAAGPTNLAAISHHFEGIAGLSFEFAPRGTHLEKLDWLQRKFLALAPETVWLFNHHQDSVAVAAVQPEAGYRLRYYHHGDHHLCLGVHLDYAEHIDMNPVGFHNCRDSLGISDNRYLPLTVKDRGAPPVSLNHIIGTGLVTCTAAGFNKLSHPYFIRYADVVPELLRVTGGRHIHIGPLGQLTLYRIRRGLRKLGLPETSFEYIPFVRSVWQALHDHQVNLYVASFPYGGARTLIEAMGAGVAIAVHLHTSSRLLSTFDMAFESALLWRTPQELYNHVQRLDIETLKLLGQAGRMKYEECYREEVVVKALAGRGQPLPPPLLSGFTPDELQQALDISTQVSFGGTLNRIFGRALQRLKSMRA